MSAYNQAILIERLNKLTDTQESIQTLSHWLNFHRKHAITSVTVWYEEFQRCKSYVSFDITMKCILIRSPFFPASPSKKLTLLYLANDVIQHSRKKGGEYVETFVNIIPEVVVSTYRSGNETIHGSVKRLLQIWYDRKVFPTELLDSIKDQLALEIKSLEHHDEGDHESSSLSKLMTTIEGSTKEIDQIEYHMKTVTDSLLNHLLGLDMDQMQHFIDAIQAESNLLCDHENKLKSRQEHHTLLCQYLFEEYKKHQEELERDIHLLQVSL